MKQLVAVILLLASCNCFPRDLTEEERANEFLAWYDIEGAQNITDAVFIDWTYNTNVTDYNAEQSAEAQAVLSQFQLNTAIQAAGFNKSLIASNTTKRQLWKIDDQAGIRLNQEESKEMNSLVSKMTGVYSSAKICPYDLFQGKKCDPKNQTGWWELEPELTEVMATSRDYDELAYAWREFHNQVGRNIKSDYAKFVELSNKGARNAGFEDTGDWWRSWYEDPTFKQDLESLWKDLLPLYEQLHAYVRRKLQTIYPGRYDTTAMPAHIQGTLCRLTI